MKRRSIFIFMAIALVVLLLFLSMGYLMFWMASHMAHYTGDEVITAMSPAEKQYFAKLKRVQLGMTYEEVISILGTPYRNGLKVRPAWQVEGSPLSQVYIYFIENHARRIRWVKIGYFFYERNEQTPTKSPEPMATVP